MRRVNAIRQREDLDDVAVVRPRARGRRAGRRTSPTDPRPRADAGLGQVVVDGVGHVDHVAGGCRASGSSSVDPLVRSRTRIRPVSRQAASQNASSDASSRTDTASTRSSGKAAARRSTASAGASSARVAAMNAGFSIPASGDLVEDHAELARVAAGSRAVDDRVGGAQHAEQRPAAAAVLVRALDQARDLDQLDEHAADPRQRGHRPERGERVVAGPDLDLRQRLEQRRLADVGRPDQRDLRGALAAHGDRVAVDRRRPVRVSSISARAPCAGPRTARSGSRAAHRAARGPRGSAPAPPCRPACASRPVRTCDAASASPSPFDCAGDATPRAALGHPATAARVSSRPFLRRWVRKGPISLSDRRWWRTRRGSSARSLAHAPGLGTPDGSAAYTRGVAWPVDPLAPRLARAARRPGHRRVPRRPRADDHGGRPAGDRRRPRRLDAPARGVLDHQRLPAGLRRHDAAGRAGWPTCGARGGCSCGRSSCSRWAACSPAWRPTLELLIAARLVQAVGRRRAGPGRDLRGLAPVPRRRPAARAGRHRRADVPGHGRGPVPRAPRSWAPSTRRRRCRGWASSPARCSPAAARARLALGVLRQRARSGSSPSWSPGRRAAAGRRRAGRAASTSSARSCSPRSWSAALGRADAPRQPGGAGRRAGPTRRWSPSSWRSSRSSPASRTVVRGLRVRDPFLDPRLFRHAGVRVGDAGLAAHRLRPGDGDRRRARCSWTGCCTAAPTSSAWRWARSPGRRRSARSLSGFVVRVLSLRLVTLVGLGASIVAPGRDVGLDDRDTPSERRPLALAVFGARASGSTVTPALDGRRGGGRAARRTAWPRRRSRSRGWSAWPSGLAILTAYGSTTIDRLYDQVYATPDAYKRVHPASRSRTGRCGTAWSIEALETWAAGEAARDHGRRVPRRGGRDGRSRSRRRCCSIGGVCSARPGPSRPRAEPPGAERSHRPRCRKRRRPRAPGHRRRLIRAPTSEPLVVRGCAWIERRQPPFEGVDALRPILADPEARVWVDVTAPSRRPGRRRRRAARRSTR